MRVLLVDPIDPSGVNLLRERADVKIDKKKLEQGS